MEIVNIREMLQNLNKSLESIERRTKTNTKPKHHIPAVKIDKYKQKLSESVSQYIENLINRLEEEQEKVNKEEILSRQSYAEKQIGSIRTALKKFDPERIQTIQNLTSTLENLKGYNTKTLPVVKVREEDTVKIFKFLSDIRLEEKYGYLREYLERKIVFEFKTPTPKEIESLEKLKTFLQKN